MRKSHPSSSTPSFETPQEFSERIGRVVPITANAIDCSLCYAKTSFVSSGTCGHREVCWLCSLRLRWICKDLNCAICKIKLESIEIISVDPLPRSAKMELQQVTFSHSAIFQEATRLISYYCPYPCGEDNHFHFKSLRDLQTHLKRDHDNASYCEICLNHRQTFLPEQTVYGSAALAEHGKSQHPGCEFCRGEKFYSVDELLYHMNQVHFKCIVCDRLDYRNEYYTNYDSLNSHFEESHFPCEYPECKEQRFVVFGDEEELRLHWLEKHGRGRAIALTGGGAAAGGVLGANSTRKKFRNKYPQSLYNTHVHFRGSRVGGFRSHHLAATSPPLIVVHEYPDVTNGGVSYNPRIHSKIITFISRETKIEEICKKIISEKRLFTDFQSNEYKSANIAFLKSLEQSVSPEDIQSLKQFSLDFKNGKKSDSDLIDFLVKSNKFDTNICADLIVLMPDIKKRERVIQLMKSTSRTGVSKKEANKNLDSRKEEISVESTVPEIPDQMFDVDKKPSLLHALHGILSTTIVSSQSSRPVASKNLPQNILSSMENKINLMDRVQLTTLSEMRNHLLLLSDSRGGSSSSATTNNLSWKHADEIVSLRPLLYRLLQIPETHKTREKELIKQGWSEFVGRSKKLFEEKFSIFELEWINAYITLSLMRSLTIGPLEVKRGEFPTLPLSAYYPSSSSPLVSVPVPAAAPVLAPLTRADFPSAFTAPLAVTARSNSSWNNYAHGLREEAFPELDIPPIVPKGPDLSRPWNCPRCTYRNSRPHTSNCEICGIERPLEVQDETTFSESAAGVSSTTTQASTSGKRVKKKIILSSATQRDYKR